jgi:hypothetical protein
MAFSADEMTGATGNISEVHFAMETSYDALLALNELWRVLIELFDPVSPGSGGWRGFGLWLRHLHRFWFGGSQRSLGQPCWNSPWLLVGLRL